MGYQHALLQFFYLFCSAKALYKGKGEGKRGTGPPGGGETAIDHDGSVLHLGTGQLALETGIAHGFYATEQTHAAIHQGGGTNGGEGHTGSIGFFNHFPQAGIGAQVGGTGHSSGQNEHLCLGTAGSDLGHRGIGLYGNAVGTGGNLIVVQRNGAYAQPRTAENIGGSEGFDVFESIGQEEINRFHKARDL